MPGISASAPVAAHPGTVPQTSTVALRSRYDKVVTRWDRKRADDIVQRVAGVDNITRVDPSRRDALDAALAESLGLTVVPAPVVAPVPAPTPSAVRRLFDAGYHAIIPIEPGGKKPAAGKDWTRYQATAERVDAWVANGNGTGLLTSASPTIDSDIDDDSLSGEVWTDAVAPIVGAGAMRRVRSNAPRFAVPCTSDVPLRSVHCTFVDAAGATAGALEVSGRDRQVVIAGRHHSGADLQWTDGTRTGDVSLLAEIPPPQLPALSAEIVEARLIPALQRIASGRAGMVRDALLRGGLSSSTVTVRNLGNSRPLGTNATAQGRELNRRVEIVISGAPIGNLASWDKSYSVVPR